MIKRKFLTEDERNRLLDMYEVDDIINILELEMTELIDIMEEYIVEHIDKFDIYEQDNQEEPDAEND